MESSEGTHEPSKGVTKSSEDIIDKSYHDVTKPSEGVTKSSEGVTKSSEGVTKPSEGVTKSTEGVTKSSESVTKSSEGVTKSSEGVTKPSEGVTKLSEGVTKSSEGVTKLSEGVTKSSEGVTKLSEGVTKPSEGVTKSSEGVTKSFEDVKLTDSDQDVMESPQGVSESCQGVSKLCKGVTESLLGVSESLLGVSESLLSVTETTVRRHSQDIDLLEPGYSPLRKHSSGDLHSRLKTRKLLGVGETDDGDVHRSKLSQILGHSDQLYIKLPYGLRIWQLLLAIMFTVIALWALIFPAHLFDITFETEEGKYLTLPVRLYGAALLSLSLLYWNTLESQDKDIIRCVLLSSIVYFSLQTLVSAFSYPVRESLPISPILMMCCKVITILLSSYFYWIMGRDWRSKDGRYYH
ncbi:uncharacterized protein LOC121380660 isoform X2 [Gigantopelta aegis]|uniref:uncharacterized protein LOC121380660 isoform X2 n=1 Tax=Gigantopelta aegis TaxID=1735272 RepID=UPI001B889C77|nr:uncharacterized protein LOC121380660 isoform X2 [Gigantopelta aegis]